MQIPEVSKTRSQVTQQMALQLDCSSASASLDDKLSPLLSALRNRKNESNIQVNVAMKTTRPTTQAAVMRPYQYTDIHCTVQDAKWPQEKLPTPKDDLGFLVLQSPQIRYVLELVNADDYGAPDFLVSSAVTALELWPKRHKLLRKLENLSTILKSRYPIKRDTVVIASTKLCAEASAHQCAS